jgi:hypothetical protein
MQQLLSAISVYPSVFKIFEVHACKEREHLQKRKNSNLLTFDSDGHLLLGHEEEIKKQISKFIGMHTSISIK